MAVLGQTWLVKLPWLYCRHRTLKLLHISKISVDVAVCPVDMLSKRLKQN